MSNESGNSRGGTVRGRSRGRGVPPRARGASHQGPTPLARGGTPGGGRGRGRGAKSHKVETNNINHGKRDISEGLSPNSIRVFEKPPEDVKITNRKLHASYSWLEAATPTIAVPGSPRVWTGKNLPFAVSPDSGRSFIDQNAYRVPSFPMLPLFVAVDVTEARSGSAKLQWGDLDFITDRNNLLKLLGFVDPRLKQKAKKPLRIDIDLAGPDTAILHRWEERDIVRADGTGFGDSFEENSTTPGPGCEKATLAGHARIISYNFSGLKMLVRCEADACFPPETPGSGADHPKSSSTAPGPAPQKIDGLTVISAGQVVPQSDLIKIKTRSKLRGISWEFVCAQMLLGDTPTHFVGMHAEGNFTDVIKRKLGTSDFDKEEPKVQCALNKLHRLLEEVHVTVLQKGRGAKLSLVARGDVLQLVERTDGRNIPAHILRRFDMAEGSTKT